LRAESGNPAARTTSTAASTQSGCEDDRPARCDVVHDEQTEEHDERDREVDEPGSAAENGATGRAKYTLRDEVAILDEALGRGRDAERTYSQRIIAE
jgi:hypothetical protein